jgi:transposase InsO family protein
MEIRAKAVVLYDEGLKTANEISQLYSISGRTLRRWHKEFKANGIAGLTPKKTGPKIGRHRTPEVLRQRIISLKRRFPAWGARRIVHQFNLSLHWTTAHKILKQNGLLFRIRAKPQPSKRFQRRHVDSLWQGDTFQFRIHDVGRVYITGFTDDCSRFRVRSKVYLRKGKEEAINCMQWALRAGRKPKAIYLDNGTQFIAKDFKAEAKKHRIKLIFGKPYHPQGRGKIEAYHKVLYQELISLKKFKSLSDFKKQLWRFDQMYNFWRKQEILGWQTPASVYFNPKYFNKQSSKVKKRTQIPLTNVAKN